MLRLIARLDVKGDNVIKGIHLEGLRVVGKPEVLSKRYYDQGIDEIIYMDAVASLYGRNHLADVVKRTAEEVFVPITVGGGIRTLEDAAVLLRSGADKVAVNTAAIKDPELITRIAARFGSQAMVLSIEAKRRHDGCWEAYTESGRESSGREVVAWAVEAVRRGAGEILLTSVDREGTRKGFDWELAAQVRNAVNVPVILSGGMGKLEHLTPAPGSRALPADALAMASVLHYETASVQEVRAAASQAGLNVRTVPEDLR